MGGPVSGLVGTLVPSAPSESATADSDGTVDGAATSCAIERLPPGCTAPEAVFEGEEPETSLATPGSSATAAARDVSAPRSASRAPRSSAPCPTPTPVATPPAASATAATFATPAFATIAAATPAPPPVARPPPTAPPPPETAPSTLCLSPAGGRIGSTAAISRCWRRTLSENVEHASHDLACRRSRPPRGSLPPLAISLRTSSQGRSRAACSSMRVDRAWNTRDLTFCGSQPTSPEISACERSVSSDRTSAFRWSSGRALRSAKIRRTSSRCSASSSGGGVLAAAPTGSGLLSSLLERRIERHRLRATAKSHGFSRVGGSFREVSAR